MYREALRDPSLSPIRTAFHLFTSIAIEHRVARVTLKTRTLTVIAFPLAHLYQMFIVVGPVVTLLTDSPYLGQAGLDWKEYYALIKEDLKQGAPAAFILTLLPNVKTRLCYQDYGSRSIKPRYFSTLLLAKVRSHISYEIELVLLK